MKHTFHTVNHLHISYKIFYIKVKYEYTAQFTLNFESNNSSSSLDETFFFSFFFILLIHYNTAQLLCCINNKNRTRNNQQLQSQKLYSVEKERHLTLFQFFFGLDNRNSLEYYIYFSWALSRKIF